MVQIKLKYKDYLLKLDNLFPFFFLLLRYFNINYYLALNYRYRFNRFYEKSRKVYEQEKSKYLSFKINHLTIKTYNPENFLNDFDLPSNYPNLVKKISNEVNEKFEKTCNCYFFPKLQKHHQSELVKDLDEIVQKDVLSIQLKDPFCLNGINELCSLIVEEIEAKFYGSYVFIDKVYVYRSLTSRTKDKGSWLWHFDNHPDTFSKVMILLTDVSRSNGGMSFYKSGDGSVYKFNSLPGLSKPFYKTRISPQNLNKICKKNKLRISTLEGPIGTTALFSENILHKANVPKEKYRDVIVLALKPSMSKITSYIDKKQTGTFNHEDVILSPSIMSQRKKRKMASG